MHICGDGSQRYLSTYTKNVSMSMLYVRKRNMYRWWWGHEDESYYGSLVPIAKSPRKLCNWLLACYRCTCKPEQTRKSLKQKWERRHEMQPWLGPLKDGRKCGTSRPTWRDEPSYSRHFHVGLVQAQRYQLLRDTSPNSARNFQSLHKELRGGTIRFLHAAGSTS